MMFLLLPDNEFCLPLWRGTKGEDSALNFVALFQNINRMCDPLACITYILYDFAFLKSQYGIS